MTSLIAASPYTRVLSPVLTHSTTVLVAPASSFETRTMKVANTEGPSPPWLVTANLLEREVCVPRPRWTSDRPNRGREKLLRRGVSDPSMRSKRTILLTAICVKRTMPPLSAARPVRAGEVSSDGVRASLRTLFRDRLLYGPESSQEPMAWPL